MGGIKRCAAAQNNWQAYENARISYFRLRSPWRPGIFAWCDIQVGGDRMRWLHKLWKGPALALSESRNASGDSSSEDILIDGVDGALPPPNKRKVPLILGHAELGTSPATLVDLTLTHCSFCGIDSEHANRIFVNGHVGICDRCIDSCQRTCRKLERYDLDAEWDQLKQFAP
jgi:hypothetical protein